MLVILVTLVMLSQPLTILPFTTQASGDLLCHRSLRSLSSGPAAGCSVLAHYEPCLVPKPEV